MRSPTEILSPTPGNLARAAELLRAGQVVGMPTETVYGLAGLALDPEALTRIFSAKERPTFDPLIVHVAPDARSAEPLLDRARLSGAASARFEALARAFWPGPLTIVLPKSPRVPDLATSGLATVAIRMPRHPVARALIVAAGAPLAAPSANRFGRISPTCAADVLAELSGRIPLILDGGPCEIGLESTVVRLGLDGSLTLLRPGGTPREAIEEWLRATGEDPATLLPGSANAVTETAGDGDRMMASPGQLESHYAPEKPLHLLKGPLSAARLGAGGAWPARGKAGVLLFSGSERAARAALEAAGIELAAMRVLSPMGELTEAAGRLFSELRALDESDAAFLLAEPCPVAAGLGYAIQDRLARASSRR